MSLSVDDLNEFEEIVGADREKLKDVEYLKTLKFMEAQDLVISFGLTDKDRATFWDLYFNQAHPNKSITTILSEINESGILIDMPPIIITGS